MKSKITEIFSLAEGAGFAIDRAAGVIRNVRMLPGGVKTKNGNRFMPSAISEAVKRYEGAKMYIDHDKSRPIRSVKDWGGVYKNVHEEKGDVRGDLHVRKSKQDEVFEVAEMAPGGVGLSIVDKGRGETRDGEFLVEGFVGDTFSVDLVAEASGNRSLFESNNGGHAEEEEDMELKNITEEILAKDRADLVESIGNKARAAVVAELEAEKKKGKTLEEALSAEKAKNVKNEKLVALSEAAFEKTIHESVLKAIEPETVSVESARAIIATNKATVEALAKGARGGRPTVVGAGARRTESVTEGVEGGDLPNSDTILRAFTARA